MIWYWLYNDDSSKGTDLLLGIKGTRKDMRFEYLQSRWLVAPDPLGR